VLNNPNSQGAINADFTKVTARTKQFFKDQSMACAGDCLTGVTGLMIPRSLEYLGALIDPREFAGARVPDPFLRETTATYPAKIVYNITGVSGTAQNGSGGGGNSGRFCYVIQPWMSESPPAFNTLQARFQVAYQDGTNNSALWQNSFTTSTPGTNFFNYVADPESATFATSTHDGLMEKVRPVSASILASYNGNLINGGGNIACALVPGAAWNTHLQNGGVPGHRYMLWEDLARQPGAYDGPLSKGAYAYWLPDDDSDLLLRQVENQVDDNTDKHQYPLLIVSGKVAPDVNGNFGANVLRLDVYINYEYTTDSRIVECRRGSRDMQQRYNAVAALSNQPTSMENEGHIDWIKTLISGACGFVIGGPVGAAVGVASSVGSGALANFVRSAKIPF